VASLGALEGPAVPRARFQVLAGTGGFDEQARLGQLQPDVTRQVGVREPAAEKTLLRPRAEVRGGNQDRLIRCGTERGGQVVDSFGSIRLFAPTRKIPEVAPLRRTLRTASTESVPAVFEGFRTLPAQPAGRRP
jgi:hypothetical protein